MIELNNHPITITDRDDLSKVQFLWKIGEPDIPVTSCSHLPNPRFLPDRLDHWSENWRVQGWIGTTFKPQHLESSDIGNLNSIVIFLGVACFRKISY